MKTYDVHITVEFTKRVKADSEQAAINKVEDEVLANREGFDGECVSFAEAHDRGELTACPACTVENGLISFNCPNCGGEGEVTKAQREEVRELYGY